MAQDTISRTLARYVLGIQYEKLPPDVVAMAKHCVLDQLGNQLRGATLHWTQPAYRLAVNMRSKREATIVLHGDKTEASYAAFVNGTFGQSCELDDVGVGGHAGAATVPVAMALGEVVGASGRDLIRAVVAGYEAMGRVGDTMGGVGLHGFHLQSVNGVYGSVTSAGILLGLDEEAMMNAYGIAGSHSCGITEYAEVGGEVKRVHTGIAARGAVQSALLAKDGLTGPVTVFEGKRGVVAAFAGPKVDPQVIIKDLGKGYRMMGDTFKPYPVNNSLLAPLDALNKALGRQQVNPQEVRDINVGIVGPAYNRAAIIVHPTDAIGAQFSLAFSCALRLVTGQNDFEDYEDPQKWADPEISRVSDLVKVYRLEDPTGQRPRMAKVQVTLADGRVLEAVQESPKGSPEEPLTQAEMEAKFRMLAHVAVSDRRMGEITQAVRSLETLPKVSDLAALLVRDKAAVHP